MKITDVKIIRSSRKSIAIEVGRDMTVTVRAPHFTRDTQIQRILDEKSDWINKKLSLMYNAGIKVSDDGKAKHLTESEICTLTERARKIIVQRAVLYAQKMGVTYNRITVRCQKTRWGSCSSKGNLNFNCLLMLCPCDVVDYVIVHELCHLLHLNHSAQFWNAVGRIVPDYKAKRDWLKEQGIAIMKRNPAYNK